MSAYIIVYRESPVRDEAAIAEYSRRNQANAAAWREDTGIQPLVAYGGIEALEGDAPDGIVLLRFPTMEQARAWYNSPEYQEALGFRLKAAEWRVVLVEGLA
ncbi:DUF1330 domain-containing protein [Novosphingobium aquae]|uniref:DUF1330 domain-containing protein n=1 Tax=Novosphingobium aquae TaxID=3133435 RepID=A0ABU8S635_9SPHN